MKKILLSSVVIVAFGLYTFFVRSGDISARLSKLHPSPMELLNDESDINTVNNDIENSGAITRNINCVYVQDEENEEEFADDEEAEKKGHYKCTTIIVTPPKNTANVPTTPTTTPTTPKTTPPSPTTPTTPPVVVTPPPLTKPKSTIWKDGTFIGDSVDAYYGYVQVSATITSDRISSISFLDYPQDRNASLQRSNYAMPRLKKEAIASQSAKVNIVSGVTYTSRAFMQSLSSALAQAKI